MDKKEFKECLESYPLPFIMFHDDANNDDGFKLSIQGETLNDGVFLYERLIGFLKATKCSYKFGTKRLIEYGHPQQSKKLLTIYIPNGVNAESFAELVHLHILDYEGGDDVAKPDSYEHYKNAIYYRNDRDEDGGYIKAN